MDWPDEFKANQDATAAGQPDNLSLPRLRNKQNPYSLVPKERVIF